MQRKIKDILVGIGLGAFVVAFMVTEGELTISRSGMLVFSLLNTVSAFIAILASLVPRLFPKQADQAVCCYSRPAILPLPGNCSYRDYQRPAGPFRPVHPESKELRCNRAALFRRGTCHLFAA